MEGIPKGRSMTRVDESKVEPHVPAQLTPPLRSDSSPADEIVIIQVAISGHHQIGIVHESMEIRAESAPPPPGGRKPAYTNSSITSGSGYVTDSLKRVAQSST